MKSFYFLILLLGSQLSHSQLAELKPFVNKVVDIFFTKNTEELKKQIATKSDLAKLKEDLKLSSESLQTYPQKVKDSDLYSEEEFYWGVLEDEIFYKNNEVIKNLDLKDYSIIYTEITECEFSANALFEIYLTVIIESNGQFLQYEIGELIYTKKKGYQFVEEPYIELLSEEIWNKSSGFDLKEELFRNEADKYAQNYFKKDSLALEESKTIEKKYINPKRKQYTAAEEIKRFYKYMADYGFKDKEIQSVELIHSIGSELYEDSKLDGMAVLCNYKINNYFVFFEITGTYFEKKMNLDDIEVISVIPLFD